MIETWDIPEAIVLVQKNPEVYQECNRLAEKYKGQFIQAQYHIHAAIRDSGVLRGKDISMRRIDWKAIAEFFLVETKERGVNDD